MRLPTFLLHLLPLWSYICPRCRREVKRNSHRCPFCGERYGEPLRVPPLCLKSREALEKYVHEKIFPRISVEQREYLAQFFTELFNDGFESGDFSAWTGTVIYSGQTLEVQSQEKYSGNYGMHANNSADGDTYCYKDFSTSSTIIHYRFYVKFVNFGSSSFYLAELRDTSNNRIWRLRVYSDGSLRLQRFYPGYGEWAVGFTASTNTWYCIEVKFSKDTSNGEYRIWVDGTEYTGATGLDTSGAGALGRITLGIRYAAASSGTKELYCDSAVVADTYIGEEGAITEIQISDSAFGEETISRPYRDLSLTDQASGQDVFSRPHREFPILESALGHELLQKTRNLSLSDIATSLEVIQKARQLGTITDTAQGLEQILKQRLIHLLDQAVGSEALARPTRVIVMADEALGQEILSKLREIAAIKDSAIGVEYISTETASGPIKTKIFLFIGDLAIQITGD